MTGEQLWAHDFHFRQPKQRCRY